jgi:hypothetical protein
MDAIQSLQRVAQLHRTEHDLAIAMAELLELRADVEAVERHVLTCFGMHRCKRTPLLPLHSSSVCLSRRSRSGRPRLVS